MLYRSYCLLFVPWSVEVEIEMSVRGKAQGSFLELVHISSTPSRQLNRLLDTSVQLSSLPLAALKPLDQPASALARPASTTRSTMCRSHGTLFYGVWVMTSSLQFAVQSYEKTKAPLQALQLIQLRLRAGSLQIKEQDSHTTARNLSTEMWKLIAQHLIDDALHQAEQAAIDVYRCEGCKIALNGDDEAPRSAGWTTKNAQRNGQVWKSGWSQPSCEHCCDVLIEQEPFPQPDFVSASVSLWLRSTPELTFPCSPQPVVQKLLAQFGLCMPYAEVWKDEPESDHCFNSLSAIALPLTATAPMPETPNTSFHRPHHNPFPSLTSEAMHDSGSSSSVVNVSLQAFDAPNKMKNVQQRFSELIKMYRLQVVDRVEAEILPESTPLVDASQDGKKTKKKKKKSTKIVNAKSRNLAPRWMVWSLCEPCD